MHNRRASCKFKSFEFHTACVSKFGSWAGILRRKPHIYNQWYGKVVAGKIPSIAGKNFLLLFSFTVLSPESNRLNLIPQHASRWWCWCLYGIHYALTLLLDNGKEYEDDDCRNHQRRLSPQLYPNSQKVWWIKNTFQYPYIYIYMGVENILYQYVNWRC